MASKILIKRSTTAGEIPTTADLDTGELAINTVDRRIFTNNSGTIVELGSTPSTLDITGNVDVGGTFDVVGVVTVDDLTATGDVDLTGATTTVAAPTADSHPATKLYVDTEVNAILDGAPAALDTLNEIAAAINDDANLYTTLDTAIQAKLPLAGGTMTGNIVLGANKITTTADPTADNDLARKAYVDSILGSATSAATSATNAATSATNAANSESNASTSATNAATSATNAATSETNAATSATAASASATSASNSATTATTKATEAATSATGASTAELNAENAQASAETAQTAAEAAQTAAETAETNAETAESNAATSASNAASSATTAETHKTDAETAKAAAETAQAAAETAQTAAETAETNAETAQAAAEAAFDNFDDRWLGNKASDPTTDNDGDALVEGTVYYNTTDSALKIYDGSAWTGAVFDTNGALFGVNNLSDISDAATARTNLGLGTSDSPTFSTVTATTSTIDELNTNYIDLATNQSPSHQEGRIFYDNTHDALAVYNSEADITLQVGQEEYLRVYNNSGATISNGTPVYVTGSSNDVPTIDEADASTEDASQAVGLATHSIENNSYGFVTVRGLVGDLDTSSFSVGDRAHVAPTAGTLQAMAPTYPYFPVDVGIVLVSHATNGCIYVEIQSHNFEELRITNNARVDNDLTVGGDLTVLGTQTIASSNNVSIGSAWNYFNSGDTIGESNTTFTGSGLDDGTLTGHFEGTASKSYYVEIDGTGTPDTFKWSYNSDLSSPEATGVSITGSDQELGEGISINFGATTGHTSGDKWSGTASPVNVDSGIASNRNTGGSGVGYTHMGLFFDVSDEKWKFFDEYDPEPEGTINTADASFSGGTVVADTFEGDLTGDVTGNLTGSVTGTTITASGDLNVDSGLFFVDVSQDNVGVGTSSPQKELQVNKDASECVINVTASDTGDAGIYFGGQTDTIKAGLILDNSDNSLDIRGYNNNTAATIDSNLDWHFNNQLHIPDYIYHSGDTDTYMEFNGANLWRVVAGGNSIAQVYSNAFVINENSGDIDFRVESNNNANMLFVDAGNDRVGVGTNTPSKKLHVDGEAAVKGKLTLNYDGSDTYAILQGPSNRSLYVDIDSNGDTDAFAVRDNRDDSQRFVVQSGGNVGIGTSSPTHTLEVASTSPVISTKDTNGSGADATGWIEWNGSDGNRLGYVGYGSTGNSDLYVMQLQSSHIRFYNGGTERFRMANNGDFHADGDVIAYSTTVSDERLKDNIQPVENALAKVDALTGYTFDYKKDGKQSAGVIAQEVAEVFPSAVSTKELPFAGEDDQEYLTVQYDQLTALFIESIKELKAEIEELKTQVKD